MKKLNFTAIDRPNETLTSRERESLLDIVTPIAQNGFGTQISREDVSRRVLDVGKFYLLHMDNQPIGFSTYSTFPNKDLLYAHGTVLIKEKQHQGLYPLIKQHAFEAFNFTYYALRTQSQIVYAATKKLVTHIYPNGEHPPMEVQDIGYFVANYLGMKQFNPATFTEAGTYGSSLTDTRPKHDRATSLFDVKLHLDYSRGDSIIVVGIR